MTSFGSACDTGARPSSSTCSPICPIPERRLLGDRVWQSFKQRCAAEGNLVPLLISQLEPQDPDPGMFRRRGPRKPKGSDPFGDLPLIQRLKRRRDSGDSARSGPGISRPGGVLSWRELPAG